MDIVDLREVPDAIRTLAGWHHAEWRHLRPGETLVQCVRRLEPHLGPGPIPVTLVAREGSDVLGSASLVPHDMETRTDLSPWLACLYVRADRRRRGIGSRLIGAIVEAAHRAGVERLHLFTAEQKAYYARLGWSVLEHTRFGDHEVDIMVIVPARGPSAESATDTP